MAQLSRTKVPAKPKTMFNVGVVAGGTSVNSIPTEVSKDVASESPDELNRLVEAFQRIVHSSIDEEKLNRSTTECRITAEVKLIGDRPGGETAVESPLISTTTAVLRAFGLTPTFRIGSTDSNIPISMGIPAVTIGRGPGGRNHSLDEWTDVERTSAIRAAEVALAIVLGAADTR